ncbi:ferrous iron transport protein A [Horticoccus luteus]|uniref:Ferrous iron transport protein A n=1 Tax=Horticoccus luteus TaxID=2862869 RepID=A0A8F9TVR8_9BACT|nr:FeoA family protein [Horticoccus luteus]QYM79025.1 ferrous iron transport protein A [Horticoccus luteus]
MGAVISLSELPPGGSATVREMPKVGAVFLRLREMGLQPGITITLVRSAPMGDPLEIKVRGYRLTLRKADARHISVESA